MHSSIQCLLEVHSLSRKCTFCGKTTPFPSMVCWHCKEPFIDVYDVYFTGVYKNQANYNPQKIISILNG